MLTIGSDALSEVLAYIMFIMMRKIRETAHR
jgi:hypothetical protein